MSALKAPPNSQGPPENPNKWAKLRMSTPSEKYPGCYMSQGEFAEKLGFSRRAVGSWEQGPKEPSRFALAAMGINGD